MKKIITFPRGGSVEIYSLGCAVTSATGEVRRFGADGNPIFVEGAHHHKETTVEKYFFHMGEPERKVIRKWLVNQHPRTANQNFFLETVGNALKSIDYGYYISTIEPSKTDGDKLSFEEGKPVYTKLSLAEWEEKARAYSPEEGSMLANLYELFLWYAYRVVAGHWTLEYICDDSSSCGNYWNAPYSAHEMEDAGIIKVGGFADGVANTKKIVFDMEDGYDICGASYLEIGTLNPVTSFEHEVNSPVRNFFATGVVVLKGNLAN